mgnify:CR=1 FL=1
MAKGKGKPSSAPKIDNSDRKSGKAYKKAPKVFDPVKRRLVRK